MHLKKFEREKYKALKKFQGDYDALMRIKEELIEEFTWWEKNIPNSKISLREPITRIGGLKNISHKLLNYVFLLQHQLFCLTHRLTKAHKSIRSVRGKSRLRTFSTIIYLKLKVVLKHIT